MPILDDPQRSWNPAHEIFRRIGAERHRSREDAIDWLLRVPLAGELTDLAPEWRQLVAERCVFWLESSESWWSSPIPVIAEEVEAARAEAGAAGVASEQLGLDL
jgi:hypothetical protein|nr:MAG TPA: hypothetical protein [Caudoviricetes sp.]